MHVTNGAMVAWRCPLVVLTGHRQDFFFFSGEGAGGQTRFTLFLETSDQHAGWIEAQDDELGFLFDFQIGIRLSQDVIWVGTVQAAHQKPCEKPQPQKPHQADYNCVSF